MKSFVALNFIAGFLHYLFLVLASKKLPAESFSALSAWLAFLSFAFLGAAVLQYLSCFVPLSRRHSKIFVAAGLLYAASVAVLPFVYEFDHTMIGALAGLMACVFGIFLGQAQVRLLFVGLSLGNVTVAVFKLTLAAFPILPFVDLERFYWAVPISYVPAVILLSAVLLKYGGETPRVGARVRGAIASTLILGTASALFPQFELMLMRSTQTAEVFHSFARLSLFYKAIFFVFLIFSQWLLPYQLRDPKRAGRALADWRLYAGAVILAAGSAVAGPLIAVYILKWDRSPSMAQIFLSCWNMGLLTWIFLLLQDLCAKQDIRRAAMALAGVFVVAAIQLLGRWPVEVYYLIAVLCNSLIVWKTVTSAGAGNPEPSSPANAA